MTIARDNVVVVDMDGTLSDCSGRVHFAVAKQWEAFHDGLMNDRPNDDVAWFLSKLSFDAHIVICTGRPERYRDTTHSWLRKWNLSHLINDILMRPEGDFRSDSVLKPELLMNYLGAELDPKDYVKLVIDDRTSVVDAWRNMGLPCWQCRDGGY